MKTLKKWFAIGTAVFTVAAIPVTAFAASQYNTPAEAVAGLTGRTTLSVTEERQSGKPYGVIAAEAGVLEAFQTERAEMSFGKNGANAGNAKNTVTGGTFVDENDDGVCDNLGTGAGNGNGRGQGGSGTGAGSAFVDENGDGICDNVGIGAGNGGGRGQGGRGLRDGSCANR